VSNKGVIIEGVLAGWQYGTPLKLYLEDKTCLSGDDCFSKLSGRRVRVMVEVIEAEPTDRLAGCKCKECGGPLCVHNHTEYHTYVEYPYAVWCNHCGKPVGPHDTTAAAAIDAYLAYLARLAQQKPEPRCPFCGGKVRQDTRVCEGESHWASWDVKCIARCCQCDAYGEGPTHQAALDDLAEWLDVCPRCGGKAEYKNDWYMIPGEEGRIRYWHWAICTDKKCGVRSPQCDSKPEVAQWWYKRRGCK
jgi:hypothetical protein